MLEYFKTLQRRSSSERIVRKSRFIGHAAPVRDEAEALRFVDTVRKEHPQATHNCYAYLAGERNQWQKASDDGEPSGTAGKPILEVIRHHGLTHAAVVVTRYFGGVLLGAGGLVRAYTDAAVAGIEAAEAVYLVLHQDVRIQVEYTWLGRLENELRGRQVLMGETAFADRVTLLCRPLHAETEAFVGWMTDLTNGQAGITLGEASYLAHGELPERRHF